MRVCAWCHRVLERLPRLPGAVWTPTVTHGICGPCLERRLAAAGLRSDPPPAA